MRTSMHALKVSMDRTVAKQLTVLLRLCMVMITLLQDIPQRISMTKIMSPYCEHNHQSTHRHKLAKQGIWEV